MVDYPQGKSLDQGKTRCCAGDGAGHAKHPAAVGSPFAPLSPWGRGVGGEGSRPRKLAPLTPHPSPPRSEGRKTVTTLSACLEQQNGENAPDSLEKPGTGPRITTRLLLLSLLETYP